MRFQTSESIPSHDPEIVLRALETCLRDVATDIVRTGPQITMRGLGPSPRAINRRDTAVLRVESEDDQTVINADVTFQASAFLGDAPQDDVVRSKLNRVFEQMKMQIDLDRKRASRPPSPPAVTQSARPIAEETAPPSLAPPTTPKLAQPSSEPHLRQSIRKPQPIESKPEKRERDPEPVQLTEPQLTREQPSSTVAAARPPASNIPDTLRPITPPPYKMVWDPAPQVAVRPVSSAASFALKTVAVLAASVILLGPSLYLVRHHASATTLPPPPPATTQPSSSTTPPPAPTQPLATTAPPPTTTQPSASTTPLPATTETTSTTTPPTTTQPPTPPPTTTTIPSASSPALNASDPKVWLQNWVAAMRTRDAAAQASFYANPVDRYLGKSNVSKADILQDKHAAIVNREGLWTVKLEDITLNRQSEDEVTVHLVKHYMAETEPAQIDEQFVPSRLKLRRINNQWKITSEQDED